MTASDPAIEVQELVREFKKGPRAVDGIDLGRADRRDLRLPGAQRRRQVDHRADAHHAAAADERARATVGGFDIVREGAKVRATIGAALQEAALDAILTGREHLNLQATLQGIPARAAPGAHRGAARAGGARRKPRIAASGGYSGGMKRRLDLAMALVHEPRILFLDEPTTGLDPQSRAALWEEVARLAHDEGMTVFLTTQYLEEADALADRIGIIDRGKIVAEGTPAELKAEIGSPSVEVQPVDPDAGEPLGRAAEPLREPQRNGRGSVTVQLPGGESELAEIVRVLDSNDLRVESLQLHQPSLDDVFLAKTGRKLEGAGAE